MKELVKDHGLSIVLTAMVWHLTLVTFGVMLGGARCLENAQFAATSDGLGTVVGIQFTEDVVEVAFDRPQADD